VHVGERVGERLEVREYVCARHDVVHERHLVARRADALLAGAGGGVVPVGGALHHFGPHHAVVRQHVVDGLLEVLHVARVERVQYHVQVA
jgi:hypothetical protein